MSDINLKIRHAKRQHSQNLDCSSMNLEYLPNELFNLKNLISLNLSNNKIKELDMQIENLVNLTHLDLENNEVEDLPKEILSLANLSSLNLKGNPVLAKLKDFDVYWKISIKNYFENKSENKSFRFDKGNSSNNIKLNSVTPDYAQTQGNFYNNNLNLKTVGNYASTKSDGIDRTKKAESLNSAFSKPTADFKNISFANINLNSNFPTNNSNSGISNNNSKNNNVNYAELLSNSNKNSSSNKKQILKDGEVLHKWGKSSVKDFDSSSNQAVNMKNKDNDKNENNESQINLINFSKSKNSNEEEPNESIYNTRNSRENSALNNSTLNKTFSNLAQFSNKSTGNSSLRIASKDKKEKEPAGFNTLFGRKLNSFSNNVAATNNNNINFQKISPISLKADNSVNDSFKCGSSNQFNFASSEKNKNRYSANSDNKNSSEDNTVNNPVNPIDEESTNNYGNCNNSKCDNLNGVIDEKDKKIDELDKKLRKRDVVIISLENRIKELEAKLAFGDLNSNNYSGSGSNSFKSNSFKSNAKPIEDEISKKRNWMDSNTSVIAGTGALDNSVFIGNNVNSSDKTIEDVKELENKLQKELLNNKRMKNQIDKLSQQIASLQNNFNSNSEDLLKKIKGINYDQIEIKSQIGQGGFSIIYKGVYLNIPVAVKVLFDPNVNEDLLSEFNNEIKMLFLLRHPNIISLLGTSRSGQKLVIVTELLENGSLFDLLHKPGKEKTLPEKTKVKIILQILNAMLYLHSSEIVHRDLKSHNILLDENFNIKLCDFGLARPKTDLNSGSAKFSGTPAYMAPEILQKKNYDEKVDVFAFGTLVWEVFTRKIPHEGVEIADLKQRILNEEKLFIPKTVPKQLAKVIEACRALDPTKRPSFAEIAKMPLADLN